MPEIGEVARIVRRLDRYLVGCTIASVQAQSDTIVFKDTTADEFKNKLQGQTVKAVRQWGKYFWLVMDKPPHPLMHLGMNGWIHIKDDPMSHYRAAQKPQNEWPPRFDKFVFTLKNSTNEIAFVDFRRLSRIRLIHHPDGNDLRNVSPLKENGPDPVIEPVSLEWLQTKLKSRKVPIKAWLLDQGAIAGIGNWVGDEILFHARIHPESYTHNLQESDIVDLHKALLYVTKTAVETDADSSKFPEDWLMLHRWGKGGKGGNKLPSGEQVEFVTVGGRTSAYVRGLQRKVGPIAGEGNEAKGNSKRKKTEPKEEYDSGKDLKEEVDSEKPLKKSRGRGKKQVDDQEGATEKPQSKRKAPQGSANTSATKTEPGEATSRVRRRARDSIKEVVEETMAAANTAGIEPGTILRRSSRIKADRSQWAGTCTYIDNSS